MNKIFIILIFAISCASYDPNIKTNEVKQYLSRLNHIITLFYDSIAKAKNEKDIIVAYDEYLNNLEPLYNDVTLFIDHNNNLISSKCWKSQFNDSLKEIYENNNKRKNIADIIKSKYNSEIIKTQDKKCENRITYYSYNLSKKIQEIYYKKDILDNKDQQTIIYERNNYDFIDIIFEYDCTRYIGYMKNGVYHGKGKLITKDGFSDGTWLNGKGNGYFIYTHIDGTIMKCNLINDKMDGLVVTEWPDGSITKRFFNNGVEIITNE
jgi:hypothetical protein